MKVYLSTDGSSLPFELDRMILNIFHLAPTIVQARVIRETKENIILSF